MPEMDLSAKAVLIFLVVAMNIISMITMAFDKWKAKKGKRRISEGTLFLLSFFFGGLGTLAAMLVFRHKTKHLSFLILIPLSIIVNVFMVVGAVNMFL